MEKLSLPEIVESHGKGNMKKNLPFDRPDEETLKTRYAVNKWAKSGVPDRHKLLVPTGPEGWLEARKTLLETFGDGAIGVLTGKRGTGKTQLGVSLIRSFCWGGYCASYEKAIDIFLTIREGMHENGERKVIQKYLDVDFLVIDAMEERGETPFEDRMLNYILDRRYDALQDTLLITNQTKERFAESAGASIISRIHESGVVLDCDWKSFREG